MPKEKTINQTTNKRTGAKSLATVDKTILKKLNCGELETANLIEALAIDCNMLAKTVGITQVKCKETSIVKKMKFFGSQITRWEEYKNHPSDTVRGFSAYALANSRLSFESKLEHMKHFANDTHFGVREWAWLSLREEVTANLTISLNILEKWSTSKFENIRRFSSEAIRPRGVWCSHIQELKNEPELALSIINNLKSDPCKYVQDSVGNWLNDAAKSKPDFVQKLCKEWSKTSNNDTDYIIKKALRSLKK